MLLDLIQIFNFMQLSIYIDQRMATRQQRNNNHYTAFLVAYKQIAKGNYMLSEKFYPQFQDWSRSQAISTFQQYVKYEQQQPYNQLQLKIQKLLVKVLEIVYAFVIRGYDITNSITVRNLGVKSSSIQKIMDNGIKYRHSMAPAYGTTTTSNNLQTKNTHKQINRLIQLTQFRLYIDYSTLTPIKGEQNIGRMIIETQRTVISYFKQKIDELINTIHSQKDHNKIIYQRPKNMCSKSYTIIEANIGHYSIPEFLSKDAKEQLKFSSKTKKRKKGKKISNGNGNGNENGNENGNGNGNGKGNYVKLEESRNQFQEQEVGNRKKGRFSNEQLCQLSERVMSIVQKSRKELSMFKSRFLQQPTTSQKDNSIL